jgi:hypothetical protein
MTAGDDLSVFMVRILNGFAQVAKIRTIQRLLICG